MYITIALSLLFSLSIYLFLTSRSKLAELKVKDNEIQKTYEPASIEEKNLTDVSNKYSSLQSSYQEKLELLRKGENRLSQYNLGVGTVDSVTYSRLTSGKTVEDIENRLQDLKVTLKRLISEKKACVCSIGNDVVVNGKKSEAKKLFNREIKLRLRCLDNEFKAAAAMVDWNNVDRLIERTKDTFNEINTTGTIVKTYLKEQYLQLKIEELRLNFELNQLKKDLKDAEREEARLKREVEREESRIKAAAEKAEKERVMMEKLVAEELSKLESCTKEQKELYELHKQELEVLRAKEKRAISLAQLTRAGYVYVISNELSFGKGVCKIGMTRRADPNDRVKELGDASVPELFDVHTFVYTDDAVKLEKYLHDMFSEQRVNLINNRKEFFTISPSEILAKLDEYDEAIEIDEFDVKTKFYNKPSDQIILDHTPTLDLPTDNAIKKTTIANSSKAKKIEDNLSQQKKYEGNTTDKEKQHKKQHLLKSQKKKKNSQKESSPIFSQNKKRISNSSAKARSSSIAKIKEFAIKEYPDDIDMQQHVYEEQTESKEFMDKATQKEIIAFAKEEYPDDYSMQQHVYEEQLESKEFMDKATQKEIKAFAIEEYPDDYSMQQHVYEEQLESKEFMDKATQKEIKAFAKEEYPDDYSMQQHVYEEQLESKEFMDKATQKEIKAFAIEEYPDDYSMQQHVYEEQLESKEFMDKATQKEIKAFAIEEYPDDYSMQQHVYEEQLDSKTYLN